MISVLEKKAVPERVQHKQININYRNLFQRFSTEKKIVVAVFMFFEAIQTAHIRNGK